MKRHATAPRNPRAQVRHAKLRQQMDQQLPKQADGSRISDFMAHVLNTPMDR